MRRLEAERERLVEVENVYRRNINAFNFLYQNSPAVNMVVEPGGRILHANGAFLASMAMPLKALAVCSGLGAYGRNNICYVPCMGSFCQLVAFYAEAPGEEAAWGEPRMMARCETCEACRVHCPTGAIAAERFLLHAERCLVFHNERA